MVGQDKSNNVYPILVGKILKAMREKNGETQLSIAINMGYQNSNFIYLIEQGRASIPAGKLLDFLRAYKASDLFTAACVRLLYPDLWNIMGVLVKKHHTSMADMEAFAEKARAEFVKEAQDLKLEDLLALC